MGFIFATTRLIMGKPLTPQEIHNLAMNPVGKDLEARGFEFVAISGLFSETFIKKSFL